MRVLRKKQSASDVAPVDDTVFLRKIPTKSRAFLAALDFSDDCVEAQLRATTKTGINQKPANSTALGIRMNCKINLSLRWIAQWDDFCKAYKLVLGIVRADSMDQF